LAGALGSGCTSLADELLAELKDWPGCRGVRIKVADDIEDWAGRLGIAKPQPGSGSPSRRQLLQHYGTELRKRDPELVAKIISTRMTLIAEEETTTGKAPLTLVYVVDSLKNVQDIKGLRRIFRDEFLFVFISADRETRWHRVKEYKSWTDHDRARFEDLDNIDRDEKREQPASGSAGQETGKLPQHADYFVVNDRNRGDLRSVASRIVGLVLGGVENSQPTADERRMHMAFSVSNGSGCLSRQVGAALFSPEGDIIGVGHNDVPRAGGGLYSVEDGERDHRCYLVGDSRCTNQAWKDQLFKRLADSIENRIKPSLHKLCDGKEPDPTVVEAIRAEVEEEIKGSDLKDATEYCRAVHAEMGALLSAARRGIGSTTNSALYVTTYPCHNCAKHILCAGVKRVVYVEPYAKSLAADLHLDGLSIDPPSDEPSDKTVLVPYEGVAPRRFHDMFCQDGDRKDKDGFTIRRSKEDRAATPRFASRVYQRTHAKENVSDPITAEEWKVLQDVAQRIPAGKGGEGEADPSARS
jgi:deoxycytidylate deaminase